MKKIESTVIELSQENTKLRRERDEYKRILDEQQATVFGGDLVCAEGTTHTEQDRKQARCLYCERDALRGALGCLLERCNALDTSATDFGLRNCEAIAQARAALGE